MINPGAAPPAVTSQSAKTKPEPHQSDFTKEIDMRRARPRLALQLDLDI